MNILHFLYYLGYLRYVLLPMLALLLLAFLSSLHAFVFLLVTPAIFDRLFISLDGFVLFKLVMILLGSLALQLAVRVGTGMVGSHINNKVSMHLRVNLLAQAFAKEQRFFDDSSNGDISKRLIVDTEATAQGIQYACLFGLYLLQFAGAACFFHKFEPWFFRIYLGVSAAHFLWAQPWKMATAWTAKKISQDYGKCYGFMWQVAGNLRLIKLLNLNRKMESDFAAMQSDVKRHFDWNEASNAISYVFARPLVYAGYGLVAFYCIGKMDEGAFSLGSLAAFTGILFTIVDYVHSAMEALGTVQRSAVSAGQIGEIRRHKKEPSGKLKITALENGIEFRSVRFSYSPEREILKGLDFRIAQGVNFGIVGHSGCGKSTVLNLLLKLYSGYHGDILVDGRPLSAFDTRSVRDLIAYLGQESYVFMGSVRNNVDPGGMLDEKKILEICGKVGLGDVLGKLPRGIHTRINGDGSPLSGGQVQRLFLARVLAKDAPVLILDEATSNLDPRTERKILEVLGEFSRGKTIVTVSHRLEVVKGCDCILVLKEGRQVQLGTYEQLLQGEDGHFRQVFGLKDAVHEGAVLAAAI